MAYYYVGSMNRVTPCQQRFDPNCEYRICREGQCPGKIDDRCRFWGNDQIDPEFRRLFKIVTDDQFRNLQRY